MLKNIDFALRFTLPIPMVEMANWLDKHLVDIVTIWYLIRNSFYVSLHSTKSHQSWQQASIKDMVFISCCWTENVFMHWTHWTHRKFLNWLSTFQRNGVNAHCVQNAQTKIWAKDHVHNLKRRQCRCSLFNIVFRYKFYVLYV